MFCINCGFKLNRETKFCPDCGSRNLASDKSIERDTASKNKAPLTSVKDIDPKTKKPGRKWIYLSGVLVALILVVFAILLQSNRKQNSKLERIAETLKQAGEDPQKLYDVSQRYLIGDELFEKSLKRYQHYCYMPRKRRVLRLILNWLKIIKRA